MGLKPSGELLKGEPVKLRIFAAQHQRNHWDVVDSLGLDDRWQHTEPAGEPVRVRRDHIVKANQGLDSRNAHLELNSNHREASLRHRHHVLNARDLGQHLLGRHRDHLFHIFGRRARKGNDDVGHGHIDLRLFFPGGDEHREESGKDRHKSEQRCDPRRLEEGSDSAREAKGFTGIGIERCLLHSYINI